jgi:hypothetical protein
MIQDTWNIQIVRFRVCHKLLVAPSRSQRKLSDRGLQGPSHHGSGKSQSETA